VTDLVIFVFVLGLVIVIGLAIGIIVAGRIDRILSPAPATGETREADDAAAPEETHQS
jgi:hypothetical protein